MNTQTWIDLATSKDAHRYNIDVCYRDKTCLVATDGHRIHLSNGLPEVEPHYLDGRDAEFPDYSHVIPKGEPSVVIELKTGSKISDHKKFVNNLKKLRAIAKLQDRAAMVVVRVGKDSVELSHENTTLGISFKYNLPGVTITRSEELELGLNLNYFIDALSFEPEGLPLFTIELRGELAPIAIKQCAKTAIIMPMRLN